MNVKIGYKDKIYFLPTYINQYNPCPLTLYYFIIYDLNENDYVRYGDSIALLLDSRSGYSQYLTVSNGNYILETGDNYTQWTIGIYPGTTPQNPPYVTTGDKITFTSNIGGISYYIDYNPLCTEPYCESQCNLLGRSASTDKNSYVYIYDNSYTPIYYGSTINISSINTNECSDKANPFQILAPKNSNSPYPYVVDGDKVYLLDFLNRFYLTVSSTDEYTNLIGYSKTPTLWTINADSIIYDNSAVTLSTTGVGGSTVYLNVPKTSTCTIAGSNASTSPVYVILQIIYNKIPDNTINDMTNKNIVAKQLRNNSASKYSMSNSNWTWLWVLLIIIVLIILFWYLNNQKRKNY